MERLSGVLMHISSLPSPYGIGTMGKAAYDFIDFLKEAGQSYWQILPVCQTGFGDSPYQSFSTFAGNPYFVDLDLLIEEGYLTLDDLKDYNVNDGARVDYGELYKQRFPILKKAMKKFLNNPSDDYYQFINKHKHWLNDYALYMSIKKSLNDKCWLDWPEDLRKRDKHSLDKALKENKDEYEFYKAIQYFFFKQWNELSLYAKEKDVSFIGDLPIYVSIDSVDAWSHPEIFQLDKNGKPTEVAGCPPDAFSASGQLWGNPLFDWEALKKDHYSWWVKRIEHVCDIYDILRIDHFRGFESYYAIPYGNKDARIGRWRKGPGIDLFKEIEKQLGKKNIIAEDLGLLTKEVFELLEACQYPGMRVLQFAFGSYEYKANNYLPHNFVNNCVAYTGTHDNDTIMGWLKQIDEKEAQAALDYMGIDTYKDFNWSLMKLLWRSVAGITIVQAQDLLGLDNDARMNTPSTTGTNWQWRALKNDFTPILAKKLHYYAHLYGRIKNVK